MTPNQATFFKHNNKDILVVTLKAGQRQAFVRLNPLEHGTKATSEPSAWMPCDGLNATEQKDTPIPTYAETRRYYMEQPEEGVTQGYMTKELEQLGKAFDLAQLKSPELEETNPIKANRLIDTPTAQQLNRRLEHLETTRKEHGQPPLEVELQTALTNLADNARNTKKQEPRGRPPIKRLLQLTRQLWEARNSGSRLAMVPARLVIALVLINPLLNPIKAYANDPDIKEPAISQQAGENTQNKANNPEVDPKAALAFSLLQSLSAQQTKDLMMAIPVEDRIALMSGLPKGTLPPLIPKKWLAENVEFAPLDKIKAGMDEMTFKQFEDAGKKLPDERKDAILELLKKACKKISEKTLNQNQSGPSQPS